MKLPRAIQAPFSRTGSLIALPARIAPGTTITWRRVEPFRAQMQWMGMAGLGGGRHLPVWRNVSDGTLWPMSLLALGEMLFSVPVVDGKTEPMWWRVRKAGPRFSLDYIESSEGGC